MAGIHEMALITAEQARHLCGRISDRKVKAILECGADYSELEQAVAWSQGDDETTPMRHLPPGGAAAQIVEILTAGEEFEDDLRDRGAGH